MTGFYMKCNAGLKWVRVCSKKVAICDTTKIKKSQIFILFFFENKSLYEELSSPSA